MKKCPFCGSDKGYYFKGSYRGTFHERYSFGNKLDEDIGDIHDNAQYSYGKLAYCRVCDKKLFKREEV